MAAVCQTGVAEEQVTDIWLTYVQQQELSFRPKQNLPALVYWV